MTENLALITIGSGTMLGLNVPFPCLPIYREIYGPWNSLYIKSMYQLEDPECPTRKLIDD